MFTLGVNAEITNGGRSSLQGGLDKFNINVLDGKYGIIENTFIQKSFDKKNISFFVKEYVLFGERFSKSFLGNMNYSVPVKYVPNRLLNLIK